MASGIRGGVIRSRAELAAAMMKAARGAGLPLAIAEDLYHLASFVDEKDVVWLTQDILAGAQALQDITHALDEMACGEDFDRSESIAVKMAVSRSLELPGDVSSGLPVQPGPLTIDSGVWSQLDALASRTYVPETEQSRSEGAGAGRIDND